MGRAGQLGIAACYRRDWGGVPGRVGRVNGDAAAAFVCNDVAEGPRCVDGDRHVLDIADDQIILNIELTYVVQRDALRIVQPGVAAPDRRDWGDVPARPRGEDRDRVAAVVRN